MKIFIDFDGVIFNTELFKKRLIKFFSENGISKTNFDKSYQYFKNQKIPYSVIKHLKLLFFLKKIKKKCRYNDILRPYIFKDAEIFLKSFSKNNLYLLSYGDLNFQKQKIKGAKISDYFRRIIITNKNKAEILKQIIKKDKFGKLEKIIFIDDQPRNIEEVSSIRNITTIQLIRPPNKSILKFSKKADFKVKNFRKIREIIQMGCFFVGILVILFQ